MSRQERRPSQVAATSARSVAVGATRIVTWWPGMLAALAAYVAVALPLALDGVGYPQLLGVVFAAVVGAGWYLSPLGRWESRRRSRLYDPRAGSAPGGEAPVGSGTT